MSDISNNDEFANKERKKLINKEKETTNCIDGHFQEIVFSTS